MSETTVRAIRGAISCSIDTIDEVTGATSELLREMLQRNGLATDDVISVFFTTSPDLTSVFPAAAARTVGFGDVPLMCASEIDVPNALPRTIRIMMHVHTTLSRSAIRHVYLRDAIQLRSDLD